MRKCRSTRRWTPQAAATDAAVATGIVTASVPHTPATPESKNRCVSSRVIGLAVGLILIALMILRPNGLLGERRVEIV